MLELTLTNQNAQPVYSFSLCYVAGAGGQASGTGTRPEQVLASGATISATNQEPDTGCKAVRVDFVQFINGDLVLG
jgi:hypothetical protein